MTLPLLHNALKAVLFRAQYRSSREADFILGGFAREQAASLSPELLQEFAFLLTHDDPEIFAWLGDPASAPPPLSRALFESLNAYARTLSP